jgi:hypothetical protein
MTQALDLAQFLPPATPNVGDTVRVSIVTPLETEWGVGGGTATPEPPIDNTTYGRRNAAWSNIIDAGTY